MAMLNYSEVNQWMELTAACINKNEIPANESAAEALREILRFHEYRYYMLNSPLITDPEYDRIYKLLEKYEAENPQKITPDSPTQRVGKGLNSQFTTVSHLVPMLSLENSYNAEDLNDWDRKAKELSPTDSIEYCVEPKYDGASISVIYENDILLRSATRGDGVQGDDITANSRQIRNLPLRAPFSRYGIQTIEIRGEVLMTKKAFESYNTQLMENGQPPLANPRNAAAGTLRLKDPAEVGKRKLEAFLYHVSYVSQIPNTQIPNSKNDSKSVSDSIENGNPLEFGISKFGILPTSHSGMLQMLWDCGFRSPVEDMKVAKGMDEVIEQVKIFEEKRDNLPYEIDGMVVKVNNLEKQDRLGMTTHHPRWAIAYKFRARQGTSKLRAIEFQVGRTGAITPVAKIDPVGIGGVTVTSISVHNQEYIREKDLKIGDTVIVERAGDVIPQIVQSLADLRTGQETDILFPSACPVCHSPLYKEAEEAVWRCINVECPAQVVERIIHFVSKDAMDMRSFGEQQVRRFYEKGFITDIPGIYRLDFEKIGTLEGFGKKSADNLKQAIEQSKSQPLHRVIYALGIRHVGETTAKALAQKINHLLDLKELTVDQLMQLEDIGPKVASSIHGFFQNAQNLEMISALENLGLTLYRPDNEPVTGGRLNGQTFLFTGTLSKLKRNDAEEMAEKAGGKLLSGVSSKLNYLVVGDDAGSKLEKAKKIPTIRILTEEEFLNLFANDKEI
jgi:DNA ligase (NAD+)